MSNIIVNRSPIGRTRSEQEENLRKEGNRSMTDEQLDKCKYLERKAKEQLGSKENFFKPQEIDQIK